MGDLLRNISEALSQARETADISARALAGEEGAGMAGGMPGADMAGGGLDAGGSMLTPPADDSDLDLDTGEDDFGASDAAVGGDLEVGRAKR